MDKTTRQPIKVEPVAPAPALLAAPAARPLDYGEAVRVGRGWKVRIHALFFAGQSIGGLLALTLIVVWTSMSLQMLERDLPEIVLPGLGLAAVQQAVLSAIMLLRARMLIAPVRPAEALLVIGAGILGFVLPVVLPAVALLLAQGTSLQQRWDTTIYATLLCVSAVLPPALAAVGLLLRQVKESEHN